MPDDRERPPSRHPGSRLVVRKPNVVRTVAVLRENQKAASGRVRPEEVSFTDADPASGVACAGAVLAATHVTYIYRAGRALFVDLLAFTGTASVVEARVSVPDLALTGSVAATPAGGTQAVLRVELAFPDIWLMGEPHLTYIEARRASGADATTMRVLRARQR